MNRVAAWTMPVLGALLISGSGNALAPPLGDSCRAAAFEPLRAAQWSEPRLDAEQQALAEFLARRYYVAGSQTERFVDAAYRAAGEAGRTSAPSSSSRVSRPCRRSMASGPAARPGSVTPAIRAASPRSGRATAGTSDTGRLPGCSG